MLPGSRRKTDPHPNQFTTSIHHIQANTPMKFHEFKEQIALARQADRLEQITIEDKYCKFNIRQRVQDDIENNIALEPVIKNCFAKIYIYFDNISKYHESKQVRVFELKKTMLIMDIITEILIAVVNTDPNQEQPIQNIATRLVNRLDFRGIRNIDELEIFKQIQTAAELLAVCGDTGLYDIYTNPMAIKTKVSLSQTTLDFIEQTRYVNPMISNPDNWTSNISGGYVSICESMLLGDAFHDDFQALDALNIAQDIAWELDPTMVALPENSKKPLDTPQKLSAHTQHVRISNEVYDELKDRPFWFVYKYDFRGRMYSSGYFVNFQSTSYKKSILNFAHKQLITG